MLDFDNDFLKVQTLDDIQMLNKKYLGKASYLSLKLNSLSPLNPEEKKRIGQEINLARYSISKKISEKKNELNSEVIKAALKKDIVDVSLPGRKSDTGSIHPVTRTIERIQSFFSSMGFTIADGPEIEDAFHCFDALNMPSHHPARDPQDTFYFNPQLLLRPHTSSVQIRAMEHQSPPLRILSPGRVYRNDYDLTHTPMFHQIEGLFIDRCVSFTQLKWVINTFLTNFFEETLEIRFRPSFFPFVEPGAEVDVKGKDGKWLEVLGCGMIHPHVLKSVNYDTEEFSGFAFGLGVERLTMLRYGVKDLRAFFENDLRFLKQFR